MVFRPHDYAGEFFLVIIDKGNRSSRSICPQRSIPSPPSFPPLSGIERHIEAGSEGSIKPINESAFYFAHRIS